MSCRADPKILQGAFFREILCPAAVRQDMRSSVRPAHRWSYRTRCLVDGARARHPDARRWPRRSRGPPICFEKAAALSIRRSPLDAQPPPRPQVRRSRPRRSAPCYTWGAAPAARSRRSTASSTRSATLIPPSSRAPSPRSPATTTSPRARCSRRSTWRRRRSRSRRRRRADGPARRWPCPRASAPWSRSSRGSSTTRRPGHGEGAARGAVTSALAALDAREDLPRARARRRATTGAGSSVALGVPQRPRRSSFLDRTCTRRSSGHT